MTTLLRAGLTALLFALAPAAQAELDGGYAMIVGRPIFAQLEPQSCPVGAFLHYQLWVTAPAGQGKTFFRADPNNNCRKTIRVCDNCYEIVVDVFDSANGKQVAHREVVMRSANAGKYFGIFSKPNGFHIFASHNNVQDFHRGNLDLLRHRGVLADIANVPMSSLDGHSDPLVIDPDNNRATRDNAIPEYDALVADVKASGGRIYAFGEPFPDRSGMHNVHQNQGNLPSSNFAIANGIWQDGAIIFETRVNNQPARALTMVRFQAQRDFTHELRNSGGVKRGDGIASPTSIVRNGSAASNGLVRYGPFTARQIELALRNVSGNPDLYIKAGSPPQLNDFTLKSSNASGAGEYLRTHLNPSSQGALHILVHAKNGPASWTLSLTHTKESD